MKYMEKAGRTAEGVDPACLFVGIPWRKASRTGTARYGEKGERDALTYGKLAVGENDSVEFLD